MGAMSFQFGGPMVKVESITKTEKMLTFKINSAELDSASKVFTKLTECLSEFDFIVTGNYNSSENELELKVKSDFQKKDYLECVSIFNTEIKSTSQFTD